ncbi:MAG: metallophosphoesterase [Turneriella sp.]|nr:metallophosphoesterase [Turneriella sp.]
MARVVAFKLVVAAIALLLLFFQYRLWKKIAAPLCQNARLYRTASGLYWFLNGAAQLLLWLLVFYPGRGISRTLSETEQKVYGALMAISYAHFVWLLPLVLFWILAALWRRLYAKTGDNRVSMPEHTESPISRKDFFRKLGGALVYGSHLLPMATGVAAISGIFLGSREIWLREKEIALKNLHDDLKGLRIVQISDIHIGILIGEDYLRYTIPLIKKLKPDYLVVTGDIIDNSNAFLPVAQRYFAKLAELVPHQDSQPRLLGVLGNHDLIDDGDVAAAGFARSGLLILRNRLLALKRGRGSLQLAGLDYPPLGTKRSKTMQQYFQKVAAQRKAELPLILLNHNPADFAFLKTQGVDLVLSGHTHGGQINLSQKQETLLNGARWFYRYYVDHYEENGAQLYVNRGLGHWFPLRVNCPAEITVLTLV